MLHLFFHRKSATPATRFAVLLLLLALASPAAAQHAVRMAAAADVQLAFPADRSVVEVPFRFEMNKIVVPLRINGSEPLDIVLDTGAGGGVLLDPDAAAKIDFDVVGPAELRGAGAGAGNEAMKADLAQNVELGLGAVTLSGTTLAIKRSRGVGGLGRHPWQGVMGRQIFESLVVEIDWQRESLRLSDPVRYEAPKDAHVLSLERRHGHVFVEGELAIGDGPAKSVELVIDSGAYHALALDRRRFDALPEKRIDDAKLGRGLNGVIRGDIGRIRELRLGGIVMSDILTRFPEPRLADVITSRSDGNVGAEILRRFTVTFDYSRQRMLLRPTEALSDPFRFSTAGFAVLPIFNDDGAAVVDDLYPDSPAVKAGLREGDEIVRIDGRTPAEIGRGEIRGLLQQDPGEELNLEVRRGGEAFSVVLILEQLL